LFEGEGEHLTSYITNAEYRDFDSNLLFSVPEGFELVFSRVGCINPKFYEDLLSWERSTLFLLLGYFNLLRIFEFWGLGLRDFLRASDILP
jgi:hypothetical protein